MHKYQTKLTQEQLAAYIANSAKCPLCKAQLTEENIDEEGVIVDDVNHQCTRVTHCQCGQSWTETYTLKAVEIDERECGECKATFKDGDNVIYVEDRGDTFHVECLEAKKPKTKSKTASKRKSDEGMHLTVKMEEQDDAFIDKLVDEIDKWDPADLIAEEEKPGKKSKSKKPKK